MSVGIFTGIESSAKTALPSFEGGQFCTLNRGFPSNCVVVVEPTKDAVGFSHHFASVYSVGYRTVLPSFDPERPCECSVDGAVEVQEGLSRRFDLDEFKILVG